MMSRHEQWDAAGTTALAMAGARAIETNRSPGLIADPFAEGFIAAVRPAVAIPTRPDDMGATPLWASLSAYVAVRCLFFDRYLADATSSGIDQVVLIAAGLDARAFRLDWPAGCRVFEIDQPEVLRFKDEVLGERGVRAGCDRVTVPVDLRDDWPAALRATGFDPGRPTVWLAEGLLQYLVADAERGLFDRVHDLSAPGSRFAVDLVGDGAVPRPGDPEVKKVNREMGTDLAELWHVTGKEPVQRFLTRRGWKVESLPAGDALARHRRQVEGGMARVMRYTSFVTARR
jgi:methyltransferase (TIGR00027 family)